MSELMATGLKRLLDPFPEIEISWLPKPTKTQTDAVAKDFKAGIRCEICGAWHHPQVVHLAYVGHAAVTKRILDVDPKWDWDFLQKNETGGPIFDADGGLWITLTILGVTRKGYGSADGKKGPNATKEIIGDAIRNAGMRFGIALELWHKGEFEKTENELDTDNNYFITPDQVDELEAACAANGVAIHDLEARANATLDKITSSRFGAAMSWVLKEGGATNA